MKPRTTIYLEEDDRQAIRAIKARYGLKHDAAAIRLALRLHSEQQQTATAMRRTEQEREGKGEV